MGPRLQLQVRCPGCAAPAAFRWLWTGAQCRRCGLPLGDWLSGSGTLLGQPAELTVRLLTPLGHWAAEPFATG